MSFSGSLDDVSVVDLLQLIRIGGRTGTLRLISGMEHASIGFRGGRIACASGRGSLKLGELLVSAGAVDAATIDAALALQEAEKPRRSLGAILEASGVPVRRIHDAVQQQLREVVQNVVGWMKGTFEFSPDELHPMEDLGTHPPEILDTQSVLLEALQMLDEQRRDAPQPAAAELLQPPPRKAEGPAKTALQLVTRDDALADRFLARLEKQKELVVSRVGIHEAGSQMPGDPPPMVLVDLRLGEFRDEALAALRRTRPRAVLLAIIGVGAPAEDAVKAGALVALPAEPELWVAWIQNLQGTRDQVAKGLAPRRELARLRRIFEDLRSGLLSTSISLSLMSIVSESVERCVLFLARPDSIVALGAFGAGPDGRSLAQVAAGMRFDLGVRNAFTACVESGSALVGSVADAMLPDVFFKRIGKPRTGQFAIFPVQGGQRVAALVYVDNGVSNRAIDDMDVLELASAQAGLAFENELLRREVSRH